MSEEDLIFTIDYTHYEYFGPNPDNLNDMFLWTGPEDHSTYEHTGEVVSLHEELERLNPYLRPKIYKEYLGLYREEDITADEFLCTLVGKEHKVRVIRGNP